MSLQLIRIWGHWAAPNPWKVVTILEELGLPYEITYLEFDQVKGEDYVKHNPNGRLPTIEDPNTDITLWESGAIIQYLIERYDKDYQISFNTFPEEYLTQQWLAFQISGQGPYFGQATWFARFHPEKIQSAIDRYVDEILRVIGVLNDGLERNKTGWLVSNKCTYADLAFLSWSFVADGLLKQLNKMNGFDDKYPAYVYWISRMNRRESAKKVTALMAKGRAEHGLSP